MTARDVVIGGVYTAKVSGRLVRVRIDSVRAAGGWTATNLATRRAVCLRSARRLRNRVVDVRCGRCGSGMGYRLREDSPVRAATGYGALCLPCLRGVKAAQHVGEALAAVAS